MIVRGDRRKRLARQFPPQPLGGENAVTASVVSGRHVVEIVREPDDLPQVGILAEVFRQAAHGAGDEEAVPRAAGVAEVRVYEYESLLARQHLMC